MVVHFGDFSVDFGSRQLCAGTGGVHLGPKAFELLELLLPSGRARWRRSQLRDQLWPRTFVSESSLTSLVTELRAALGDEAEAVRASCGRSTASATPFCGEATEVAAAVTPAAPRGSPPPSFLDDREIALSRGRERPRARGRRGRLDRVADRLATPCPHPVSPRRGDARGPGEQERDVPGGKRLTSPAASADGDEIRLGRVHMTFRVLAPRLSTRTEAER